MMHMMPPPQYNSYGIQVNQGLPAYPYAMNPQYY
jgi:hypothetical protein